MTTTAPTLTGAYTLDTAHTRLGFVARHAMVTKVRGVFADFTGTAVLDSEDPTRSHAEVTIAVASVDTGNAQRDEHLRTNDFFDAATYPEIRFVSTKAESLGDDNYRLTSRPAECSSRRRAPSSSTSPPSAADPPSNHKGCQPQRLVPLASTR